MIYINFVILTGFLLLYLLTRRSGALAQEFSKKEHKLYLLYPMAGRILQKTGIEKRLLQREHIKDSIQALYITSKPEVILKLYWYKKLSMVLFLIFTFNLFSLLLALSPKEANQLMEGKYLIRPQQGQGADLINLEVSLETMQETKEDGTDHYRKELTIPVKERAYTKEELDQVMKEVIRYLDEIVLGNNADKDHIVQNLNFKEEIPGTGIAVGWKPEEMDLIGRDGSVHNEDIDTFGTDTRVTAVLEYEGEIFEHVYMFHIYPRQYTREQIISRELSDEIAKASDDNRENYRMELPDQVEGYALTWREKQQPEDPTVMVLGVVTVILFWIYEDKDLEQKMKKRKEQMLLDYPDIINKFTLLVNAGMTVKQAWNKITQDYEGRIEAGQMKKRFAYEEMLITGRELHLGKAEGDAYEQFGRRISLLPYMKFASLIAQNLKKGSKGLSELLSKEAIEAFEERKESVKRLGEEAGTKLLIPMMIMLIIVFIIILIPAFVSFHI